MRQEHLVDEVGERLQVGRDDLEEIVHLARQRIGFLHLWQAGEKLGKALRIVSIVGGERDRDDVDQREPEAVAVERRAIALDETGLFQPLSSPRALRG